jgi:hypothetical protein
MKVYKKIKKYISYIFSSMIKLYLPKKEIKVTHINVKDKTKKINKIKKKKLCYDLQIRRRLK